MAVVVVGGHTRNVGKTSVVAGLIAGTRELAWTAFKLTQFGHGLCSANGQPCGCETAEHTMAISEERERGSGTDSSRYLAAGAARSFWVRTRQGQLDEAMPRIRKEIERGGNVIIESNSVLRFLRPDVYVSVLDPSNADFKESAKRYLDRADALVLPHGSIGSPAWSGVSLRLVAGTPVFASEDANFCSRALVDFVRERLIRLGAVAERSVPLSETPASAV